jgi:hypothetical protein
MIACPACKRRAVGSADLLWTNLDGSVQCPACGGLSRLDQMSRLLVSCPLALLLWLAVLHWDLLFSGYLFLFSTVVILAGWRVLSAVAMPALALERSPDGRVFDRKQTLVSLAIMIATAVLIDSFMSYRTEADSAYAATASGTPPQTAR